MKQGGDAVIKKWYISGVTIIILCLISVVGYGFHSHSAANGVGNETGCQVIPGSSVAGGNASEAVDRLTLESEQIAGSYENISNIRMACKKDDGIIYHIDATVKVNAPLSSIDETAIKERFAECAGISADDVLITYELSSEAESE